MSEMSHTTKARIDPPYDWPDYRSTAQRAPSQPLVSIDAARLRESHSPVFGEGQVEAAEADLTRQHDGQPLGERISVSGRLLDSDGRPIAGQLVELWQCNAAGRYRHAGDVHPAPLDPNFTGAGRALSGPDGTWRFVTIRPGAYPWGNHPNAWRPAHLHFSVFGRSFTERLVTQMYFPGDPLLEFDPIFNSVRDERARSRLLATFDWSSTEETWSLGYRFDLVVGGHLATPLEAPQ
ncbi:MAG TPA: protocatechuate 3,4-dioxygenase subunit beta [Acidimicrobiales bacterium]|nr:protocatechuate 3,4-dioxygenase subunit beta [Acidimicrobiales bacterium]